MIVCLMGPSASGKSTLAKALQASGPDVFARVAEDYFLVPRPDGQSMADYLASPLTYDWRAVDRAMRAPAGSTRSTPDVDFEAFVWRSEVGGIPIGEAPIYLLDGMRPHPQCDFVVLLDIDEHEQRHRLVDRDRRWGTAVADRYSHLTATYEAGCAELHRAPDLRLCATEELEVNVALLMGELAALGVADAARLG